MILNQSPDMNMNKVYSTLISEALFVSILISGKNTVTVSYNGNCPKKTIYGDGGKAEICLSNATAYCMVQDVYDCCNNENDMEIEKVMFDDEKLYNIRKLETIADLEENWNGNNAKAFPQELVAKVRNILTFLEIQPEVFPTACNSLQLEYDKPDGSHLEIEITMENEAEIFLVNSIGKEDIMKVASNVNSINKVVKKFYG